MTDADWAHLRAAADAEAAGDPVRALRTFSRIRQFDQSLHATYLATLAELGDDAPGWMYSRWITVQAQRPLWNGAETTGPDAALVAVVEGLYADGVDLEQADCPSSEIFVALLYQRDWVLRQLTVYDHGGMRDFVETMAGADLLARADRIQDWVEAPMGGYRLESDARGCLEVTDLADGARIDVLDLGLLAEHQPGTCVIGRIVPTSAAPGRMFEWRPLLVDEETARQVAGEARPEGWFDIVVAQHAAGALPHLFSYLDDTALVSDLPQRAWVWMLEEHQIPDLPVTDGLVSYGDVALQVCENVLHLTAMAGRSMRIDRQIIAALMLEPGLAARLRERLAVPQHARAWRILEEVLPEPASARCGSLVALTGPAMGR